MFFNGDWITVEDIKHFRFIHEFYVVCAIVFCRETHQKLISGQCFPVLHCTLLRPANYDREQVASDILLVLDSTNQQCMLLSCTWLHYFVQDLHGREVENQLRTKLLFVSYITVDIIYGISIIEFDGKIGTSTQK